MLISEVLFRPTCHRVGHALYDMRTSRFSICFVSEHWGEWHNLVAREERSRVLVDTGSSLVHTSLRVIAAQLHNFAARIERQRIRARVHVYQQKPCEAMRERVEPVLGACQLALYCRQVLKCDVA